MLVGQLCPILFDPMDCSPPGSSVHGILQARILEWVAISFSRGSSDPGVEPRSPRLQADSLPSEPHFIVCGETQPVGWRAGGQGDWLYPLLRRGFGCCGVKARRAGSKWMLKW